MVHQANNKSEDHLHDANGDGKFHLQTVRERDLVGCQRPNLHIRINN
jgi:hypothetical protein